MATESPFLSPPIAVIMLWFATLLAGADVAAPAPSFGPLNCFANPNLQRSVRLLEPRGLAPATDGRLWILIDAAPSGEDIRAAMKFEASAQSDGTASLERLDVDGPFRISSRLVDAPATGVGEPRALWILSVRKPRTASTIQLTYTITVSGHTQQGRPCEFTGGTVNVGKVRWSGEVWPR